MTYYKATVFLVCMTLLLVAVGAALATTYTDNFSNGLTGSGWNGNSSYWGVVYVSSCSTYYYQANYNGDTSAYATNWSLFSNWTYKTDFCVLQGYNGSRFANYDLAMNNAAGSMLLADVQYATDTKQVYIQVQYLMGGTWYNVLTAGWLSNASPNGTLQIQRNASNGTIAISLNCDNGFSYNGTTSAIPLSFLDGLSSPGLRVYEGQVNFTNVSLVTTPSTVIGTHTFDDYGNGLTGSGWNGSSSYWGTQTVSSTGKYYYQANYAGDTSSWATKWPVSTSWVYKSDYQIKSALNANTVNVDIAMKNSSGSVLLYTDSLFNTANNQVYTQVQYYSGGTWTTVLTSGWLNAPSKIGTIEMSRATGSGNVAISLTGSNGFVYTGTTSAIPTALLDSLTIPGLRIYEGKVWYGYTDLVTGTLPESSALQSARSAVDDVMENFWTGTVKTGHIMCTHGGYSTTPPGVPWEAAQCQYMLENLWEQTNDPVIQSRVKEEWTYVKGAYTTNALTSCGVGTNNVACDDSAWTSLMLLKAYTVTNDTTALTDAETLVNRAYNRWYDTQLGGGMWYDDSKTIKSLYQVGIALAAQKIYSLTGISTFNTIATNCYNWMQTYLLRSDNIYWCDYNSSGGVGSFNDIGEAGSVTFLAGNMGMALMNARYYASTGTDSYRQAAVNTAAGIQAKLINANGILIDDRDSWTNGAFVNEYSKEVLTLKGICNTNLDAVRNTGIAIPANDRTTDSNDVGYYGGCWDGPITTPNNWTNAGSYPQMIMTSATAVDMVVGASRTY